MRVVQLSDIHLSAQNLEDLKNYYREALIDDLKNFNAEKKIDIIVLTGDLVDKGGQSLGDKPYEIFEQEFIQPVSDALHLPKEKILFIAGNHDIQQEFIEKENEFFLAGTLTKMEANNIIKENELSFTKANKRVEKIKSFEKFFHEKTPAYKYSNNESMAIDVTEEGKVGFALINDSWRSSPTLKKEQHFIGFNQLFNARNYFREQHTDLNIAVFHHPLEAFNINEAEEIENILKSKDFDIALFGHTHDYKIDSLVSANGGILMLNGRAAFNDADEQRSRYQPGYSILDVNIKTRDFKVYARKFIKNNGFKFDRDVDSLTNGEFAGVIEKNRYFQLNKNTSNPDDELPSGYSADVDRIVKLLIGKSLYPNPYIFVRELIQNAVDACNRLEEKNTHLAPKITVNINTQEHYFEVRDEGDGMTKKVLKEHFAVIGKSISQDFNEANGNINLISQFGIGFISTFIAAQKVSVTTKGETEERINFEIADVFKGFDYLPNEIRDLQAEDPSGTTVRVYMKKEYSSMDLFGIARSHCRHIRNIEFYVNGVRQQFAESWNVENGIFPFVLDNSKYKLKLTISPNARNIIASNSGFLINNYSPQIIPIRFPFIIGGEVNFKPRSVDFDISRTNIIESQKSIDFKKEMSVSLRKLFRDVIEADDKQLKQIVLGYLQFYYTTYDAFSRQYTESYVDFYSKKELLDLCLDLSSYNYNNENKKLRDILAELKIRKISFIYINKNAPANDIDSLVSKYLYNKGHFLVPPVMISAQFRDGQQAVPMTQFFQSICKDYGLTMIDLSRTQPGIDLNQMKIGKEKIPEMIWEQIVLIEKRHGIKIEIADLNKSVKPFVKFQNQYFINYDYPAFQQLILDIKDISGEKIKTWLLGLFGLSISS